MPIVIYPKNDYNNYRNKEREVKPMIEYIEEDIKEVMEITGLDKTKAEKLFQSVAKDIDDGTDDELSSYDVIDVIKLEHKAKTTGADKMYVASEKKTPTVYKFDTKKRTRKENPTKQDLIKCVESALTEFGATDLEITNKEREVVFFVNGVKYKIVLSAPRS